jgi:hypothetical protein
MEIIFDDSFRFLSNLQTQEDVIPTRISSLGSIILEKNIRLAVDAAVKTDFESYKRTSNKKDRRDIVQRILGSSHAEADKEWFMEQVENYKSGTGSGGGWNQQNDDLQGTLIQESNIVGEAGAEVGTMLALKEAVIARLRMRGMSDQQINDILVLFMEKVMLPFSETIKILDYCLEESLKARVDPIDLMEFFAYHYREKQNFSLTKSILDQAVKIQELNPSLDIFNLLKNAAIGNQTEVSKTILIKDPDARLIVNNLISLTQSNLPEQDEQVRRNFQASRDAVLNYSEKLRIQKALVDMMMSEGMNKSIASQVANMSAIFKMLMTQPLFRGLKQVYYDLQAAKYVIETFGSMLTDTQPLMPRVNPREEQIAPQSGMFPYQRGERRLSSTNRFVPLKKNNLVTAQAITNTSFPNTNLNSNPIAGSPSGINLQSVPSNTSPNVDPVTGQSSAIGLPTTPVGTFGGPAQAPDSLESIQKRNELLKSTDGSIEKVISTITEKAKALGGPFEFICNLFNGLLRKIGELLKSQNFNFLGVLEQIIQEFVNSIKNSGTALVESIKKWVNKTPEKYNQMDPSSAETSHYDNTKKSFVSHDNFRLSQYNQQVGTETYANQQWAALFGTLATALVAFLGSKGLVAAFRGLGRPGATGNPFASLSASSLIADIVNLVLPIAEFIKSFFIEVFNAFSPGSANYAPNSALYYDRNTRQLSAEGKRRLYNHQQVRVSLGISNEENLALARAEKQRMENMATVRTQTEILQRAMDQTVYLGGKSDVAPNMVPKDLENKINVFIKFVKSVQDACQAEYLILKKAVDRAGSKLDAVQKIQVQTLLSGVRNDMSVLQSLISEYSSSALVMEHIQRKRKLMMTLGPTLKRMQALESLGISKAALITGKNGVLQQLSRVRHEEASALQKLRKEYMEKTQLLDRPDIAQKEFAYPVDTKAIKLPLPPLPPTAPTSV